MAQTRTRVGGRLLAAVACSALVSGTMISVGMSPAAADVSTVSGSAFGYYVNVGLFGGPATKQGAGQVACVSANNPPGCTSTGATSASAEVALPPGGSASPVTASDADGAKGQYGPAVIFGGLWPDNVASAQPSGPMSASTQGTPGPGGSVTSSADIVLHPTPIPVTCAGGFSPPCTAPGGVGPGPLTGSEAHSTCSASESGVSGSTTWVNGVVELKYDSVSQLPIVTEPIPVNPPPNYTRSGTIDHVGDRFTIVFNEQIVGPNSITVNAAHMYLLGEVARGDMVVGSSTCTVTTTSSNGPPEANDDAYNVTEDTPLTVSASGLLSNDTDPDDNPLTSTDSQAVFVPGPSHPAFTTANTYTFPSDPVHGTALINPDGTFTYTPDANYTGTDTFSYVARDASGANDTGLVTITVEPVPDAPVAVDDASYRVTEDMSLTVDAPGVLGNDTDGDGDPLTAGSASTPAHGSVTLNADGSFTYVPVANYLGTDSFTYVVSDGTGNTDTGTVTIAVVVDEAMLLKDIVSDPSIFGSNPSRFTILGGSAYFLASAPFPGDPATGLWKTDGTAAGTVQVKNFQNPTSDHPTLAGDTLYFAIDDGVNGRELWKSDGTEAGTVLVKDINVGSASSNPANYKAIGTTLYFSASNGTTTGLNGIELWKTDGTAAGTAMVKDINVGTASGSPSNLAVMGSTLFFSATNGTTTGNNGFELWTSDGTAAGTVLVKDINVGTASGSPTLMQVIGSTVYFRATNGTTTGNNGSELWKSDGTAAGTVLVKDLNVGTASGNPINLTVFGSSLLFSATDGGATFGNELWKSDGTAAGTVVLGDINLGPTSSSPSGLTVIGGVVHFVANNGTTGVEPWKTDGTEAGTVLIKDVNPGTASSNSNSFTAANGAVYFSANNGTDGAELWKTDGTTAGTVLAKDIASSPGGSSSPRFMLAFQDTMLFVAYDDEHGDEPWRLTPPKQAPVAADDTYATDEGTPLTVAAPGVLANDTDGNGDALTAGAASDPANGSVSLSADGSFAYTPDAGFTGTDTFTYEANDGDGGIDTALVTVTVTDVGPSVSVGSLAMPEGDAGVRKGVFTISLSEPSASTVTVQYATADGTATAGSDYTAISGTATFAPGATATTVKVSVTGDISVEGAETFTLVLSAASGGTIAGDTGTGTILDDESATLKRLAIGDVVVHEGDGGARSAVFTVSLSKPVAVTVTVLYATANGTALKGSDYTKASGKLTFAPGVTSMTIAVPILPDLLVEADETFTVNLSGAYGATISDASGLGTIVDDD